MATPKCEFTSNHDIDDAGDLFKPDATVYGGFAGAGSWAGYACEIHAKTPGFSVRERLEPVVSDAS